MSRGDHPFEAWAGRRIAVYCDHCREVRLAYIEPATPHVNSKGVTVFAGDVLCGECFAIVSTVFEASDNMQARAEPEDLPEDDPRRIRRHSWLWSLRAPRPFLLGWVVGPLRWRAACAT